MGYTVSVTVHSYFHVNTLAEGLAVVSLSSDAFAKWRKVTIIFAMSVSPSARNHWTDFREILFEYFQKFVEKIQGPLKSDKNKGCPA